MSNNWLYRQQCREVARLLAINPRLLKDIPNNDPGLMAAIVTNPKDWELRYIYADWVADHDEEVGEARSHTILGRTQVEQHDGFKCDWCGQYGNPKGVVTGNRLRDYRLCSMGLEGFLQEYNNQAKDPSVGEFVRQIQTAYSLVPGYKCECCNGTGVAQRYEHPTLAWVLGYELVKPSKPKVQCSEQEYFNLLGFMPGVMLNVS